MERLRFNTRRYEDNLSVLGRKVLNVLVQKWRSDRNGQQKSTQSERVLPCRGTEYLRPPQIPTPPMICNEVNTEHYINDEQPFIFNSDRNHHNISTASELLQTFQTSDQATACISEGGNVSCHDLKKPVIKGPVSNYMYKEMLNINDESHTHKLTDKDKTKQPKDVDWNDMFDTELFSTEAALVNARFVLEQIKTPVYNTFNIQFPCEPKKKSETKGNFDNSKYKDNKDSKKSKRKNQPITDAIPKKVKKVQDEPKISFRKQKYTTTVNHWLNDVDPNNVVERNYDIDQNETKARAEIVIEKAKEKSNKKTIQAQLANKDGIMKFRKPKSDTMKKLESDINDESTHPHENNIVKKLVTPEKNKVDKTKEDKIHNENKTGKAMKNKPKFVVPLKSQIPIKDVEFQVKTLEGNNIDDHIEPLSLIDNQELVLVLIYSNGFCQLNNHYTEDTCDPEGFLICLDDDFIYFKGDHQMYKKIIQSLLEKNKIVCYRGKTLLTYLKCKLDLDVYKINIIDVEIGGSILDPDNPPENFSELQKLLSFTPQFTIATECVLQKTAWYSTLLKECASKLVNLLVEEELWNVFTNIEMKLLPIIAEMERRGVSVDLEKLKTMEDILLTKMKSTELECYKAAGKTFQINSPVQVRALIYDELKLDAKCNMRIRETLAQGAKSTSESMLRGLVSVHPLPRLILEYRHLHKAHATFLTGIAQHVKDGTVRPTWVQTAAATGRIASNNPNLQAIPKSPFSLVLYPALSQVNNTDEEALSFRSVYTSRGGYTLLACDFKHVECRVFAHAAGDGALLAALRTSGDLFRALAHKWLQKAERAVSCEDRERTKRIVYASLYGAGVRRLADILGVGYDQALAVQTSFNRTFPSLKTFGEGVVSRCAAHDGKLRTLCGRMRTFANIACAEYVRRSQAERQAVNFIIQGSAADLCKMAMVEACSQLRNHSPPLEACLLLQIHDELVWEVGDEHLDTAAVIIKRAMEGCGLQSGIEDPLPVAVSVGKNWGEMTEYHIH